MKQRIFRTLCALTLAMLACVSLALPAAAAGTFRDVPAAFWAAKEIERCAELGFFKGETATSFGVGHPMTRGNFAVVLCRFMGWDASDPRPIFSDVSTEAFCAGAVAAAYDHGAVTRQSGAFRPYDAITREELAVMLMRALGYGDIAGLAAEDPDSFQDVTSNRGYLTMAHEMGIVNGTSATAFSPNRPASREQAAVMLIRAYDHLHGTKVGELAVAREDDSVTSLAGRAAVAISAYRIVGGPSPRLETATGTAGWKSAAARAGAKALLRVTGDASAMKAPVKTLAPLLTDAVERTGCAGLYLDIEGASPAALGELAAAMRGALGEKLFYLTAEAPRRGAAAPDYGSLVAAADKLVLRVPAKAETVGDFPVGAVDPLEDVYYALAAATDSVPAGKLALAVDVLGNRFVNGARKAPATASEIENLLARSRTARYHSDRYACAYLQSGQTVVWYLEEADIAARRQLAGCFGVDLLCLSAAS